MGNSGNRQDNRSRGNAAQLLEKYKSLARDAQMQGDRVQTEYYLQFADHYFRVLSEHRSRYEEQRQRRDDFESDEDEDQNENEAATGDSDEDEAGEERQPERAGRERQRDNGSGGEPPSRRRRGQPRENGNGEEQEERISLDVLPPAIAAGEEAPRAPRRRGRRPSSDTGEGEVAPAA